MQTVITPTIAIASSVPGRMHLKLPPCDWSGREYTLKETMHAITGVTDLRWTKITNSLVLYYDRQRTSSEEILDECQRALTPLVVSNTSILAVPVGGAAAVGQSEGHAVPAKASNPGNGEKPSSPPSEGSISLGRWLLGVSLVVVGAVLFLIPFVPGWPLLLAGLAMLQLT